MKEYKGYIIDIKYDSKDKEYPYKIIARKGQYRETSKGYSEEQAISLIQEKIDNIDSWKEIYKDEPK